MAVILTTVSSLTWRKTGMVLVYAKRDTGSQSLDVRLVKN